MLKETISELLERDLLKLKDEINFYPDEARLWRTEGQISNSAGNLCLHLIGNLNHFIGATLGQTGYIRDRDREFVLKNVPRTALIERIDQTVQVLKSALAPMDDQELEKDFPLEKHGSTVTNRYMLLHLLTHLNYHLGQVNYHRRLIAG